jgi:hypothetical protein
LLAHDLRDLLEQDVQIAHALLDVADLLLPLDDQRLLEVDLVLRRQALELLLLLLLEELCIFARGRGDAALDVDGRAGGGDGGLLLFEGLALEVLEGC